LREIEVPNTQEIGDPLPTGLKIERIFHRTMFRVVTLLDTTTRLDIRKGCQMSSTGKNSIIKWKSRNFYMKRSRSQFWITKLEVSEIIINHLILLCTATPLGVEVHLASISIYQECISTLAPIIITTTKIFHSKIHWFPTPSWMLKVCTLLVDLLQKIKWFIDLLRNLQGK
jgi:hypothetical protein